MFHPISKHREVGRKNEVQPSYSTNSDLRNGNNVIEYVKPGE